MDFPDQRSENNLQVMIFWFMECLAAAYGMEANDVPRKFVCKWIRDRPQKIHERIEFSHTCQDDPGC